jgi:hypothetical protein
MQSTSPINFTTVNALNEIRHYITIKERGREANGTPKQSWGIEMNNARELYLKTYGAVDSLDLMIKRCRIGYQSFKYWHSPKNHALAMAVCVAYDMYKECLTDGNAQEYWKLSEQEMRKAKKELMSFYSFQDKLSLQGLQYDPVQQCYPGDKDLRGEVAVLMTDERGHERKRKLDDTTRTEATSRGILTQEQYTEIKKKEHLLGSRFCGDLTKLKYHTASKESLKHKLNCAVCGETTYVRCSLCNVGLHDGNSRGNHAKKTCFVDFHDICMYGLCRHESSEFGKDKNKWIPPTQEQKQLSRENILRLAKEQASNHSNKR